MKILLTIDFFDDTGYEVERILSSFKKNEFSFLHIRKKQIPNAQMKKFLKMLPEFILRRSVLHSHYELMKCFGIDKLHCSYGEYKDCSEKYFFNQISVSCHTFSEIKSLKNLNIEYFFLSPIFNSISKKGYESTFRKKELSSFLKTINSKIIALGGITQSNYELAIKMGFFGAVFYGHFWHL